MSKANTWGGLLRQGRLAEHVAVSDDWNSAKVLIDSMDNVSLQLISYFQEDAVTLNVADNVVASTKTFTFANYSFTGKSGCVIRIAGAAHAGHNGDFTVLRADSPLVGAWSVGVSNTFSIGMLNDPPDPGEWTPIPNSEFSPAVAAVTGTTVTADETYQTNQPVVALLPFRAVQVSFAYTSGLGSISVFMFNKGAR
jgi:hypothetical protein